MTKVLVNDQFVAATEHCIYPDDRGLLLGDGLFETLHVYAGNISFFADHWQRLRNGAKILGLKLPFTSAQLATNILQLLHTNDLITAETIIRLTLTRGCGPRGLSVPKTIQPTSLLTAATFSAKEKNYHLHVVDIKRNEFSPLANIKSLNYLDNILAKQQAVKYGADDALMLNTQGNVACASASNVFMVVDNRLQTPQLKDGVLPGVMRKQVLRMAKNMALPVIETSITLTQLLAASEIFLTNSVLNIAPVIRIDQQNISHGKTGEITKRMQNKLADLSKGQ